MNRELEAFSYSVSHDLRAPLRHISGFAMMLEESASHVARRRRPPAPRDDHGRRRRRMGRLIDDLLSFSRVGRTELARSTVDLDRLGRDVQAKFHATSTAARSIGGCTICPPCTAIPRSCGSCS